MGVDDIDDSVCPIARTLSIVGDRWSMLILRELAMGCRKFDDIQANTGISSQVLAMRLKRLEEFAIIERRAYSHSPARFEYYTTQKGEDLDPLLLLMRSWGIKWGEFPADTPPAVEMQYRDTGEKIGIVLSVGARADPFRFAQVNSQISDAFSAERASRQKSFRSRKDAARRSRRTT